MIIRISDEQDSIVVALNLLFVFLKIGLKGVIVNCKHYGINMDLTNFGLLIVLADNVTIIYDKNIRLDNVRYVLGSHVLNEF